MAVIGNLGSLITFEVSDKEVLTFNNMSQTVKGRWATHNVIHSVPRSEFLGADSRNVSLNIHLSAMHGVKPRSTIESIESAVLSGSVMDFVIGGRKIGSNRWVITSMSESWNCIYSNGELVSASVSLTLQEYV